MLQKRSSTPTLKRRKPALARPGSRPHRHGGWTKPSSACTCGGGCPKCKAGDATFKIDPTNSALERQADQVATRMTGGGIATRPSEAAVPSRAATARAGRALSDGGRPLTMAERGFFETKLGAELSAVRIHQSERAGAAAQGIGARAYAIGNDVAFAPGEYDGTSAEGQRLLAHELTHTQQQTPQGLIQRAPAEKTDAAVQIGAVFPFKKGTRVQALRILDNSWFDIIKGFSAEAAKIVSNLERRPLEVVEIGNDTLELQLSGTIELPAEEEGSTNSLTDLTVRLSRKSGNDFLLNVSAKSGDLETAATLFDPVSVSIQKSGGGFTLSAGGPPLASVTPGNTGGIDIAAQKAGALDALPKEYRDMVPDFVANRLPDSIDLINLSQLPDAEEGSSAEKEAIKKNVSKARSRTAPKRQKVSLGAGIMSAGQLNPMLEGSWQINFRPIDKAGGFFQVPLRVAIQYAPTASVLGRVTSGVDLSLAQLDVPINVQIFGGVGAGAFRERDIAAGTTGDRRGAAGLVGGAGIGLELRTFRMDLRYDYLLNFVSNSPNAHALGLQAGFAF